MASHPQGSAFLVSEEASHMHNHVNKRPHTHTHAQALAKFAHGTWIKQTNTFMPSKKQMEHQRIWVQLCVPQLEFACLVKELALLFVLSLEVLGTEAVHFSFHTGTKYLMYLWLLGCTALHISPRSFLLALQQPWCKPARSSHNIDRSDHHTSLPGPGPCSFHMLRRCPPQLKHLEANLMQKHKTYLGKSGDKSWEEQNTLRWFQKLHVSSCHESGSSSESVKSRLASYWSLCNIPSVALVGQANHTKAHRPKRRESWSVVKVAQLATSAGSSMQLLNRVIIFPRNWLYNCTLLSYAIISCCSHLSRPKSVSDISLLGSSDSATKSQLRLSICPGKIKKTCCRWRLNWL